MPSSELGDRYLKLFRPHLAADRLNRNIRSHRHAESRFRHARDERIGDWQNRQRVLFADVQKFLDGTALTDTLLEYDNARDKEIDTLRATCVKTIRKLSVFIKKSTRTGAIKTPDTPG